MLSEGEKIGEIRDYIAEGKEQYRPVDADFVEKQLSSIARNADLSRYVL